MNEYVTLHEYIANMSSPKQKTKVSDVLTAEIPIVNGNVRFIIIFPNG